MAASVTFCCRLFQTSMRHCFSSSTMFIRHSHTLCCIAPQTLQFRSRLFGGQRSGPMKSGISYCSCLCPCTMRWSIIVLLKDKCMACNAWLLAASAERAKHHGNTGHWLSFQRRQRSTQCLSHTYFRHSNGNHMGYLQFEAKFMICSILKFPEVRCVQ